MTEIIVEFPSPLTEKEQKMIYGYHGELIRCRNCRHRLKNHTCLRTMKRKPDDGYCDEGEIDEGSVLAKYMAV